MPDEHISGEQLEFSIINTAMTVEAMRDSGYKSTAHALAELIDNSIEANATRIEIFGVEERSMRAQRQTSRLIHLAVLDNGCGMNPTELRGSLRYGQGTRDRRRSIGRFGVGLPNSSMSQAQCVDIWSWQNGVTNACHTRLSIKDVKAGMVEIPEPTLQPLPEIYYDNSQFGFESSGTLVQWSQLDRVEWRRAASTFRNTEILIGRIYRRFLASHESRLPPGDDRQEELGLQRQIVCIPVQLEGDKIQSLDRDSIVTVRPNDPLYLMNDTSCPEDFGQGPMFEEMPSGPIKIPIELANGKPHNVIIRGSYARPHVRNSGHELAEWPSGFAGGDAGHTPWGKHAATNLGVSVMRAHREIELDQEWVNNHDPTERWWTVEVDFPPALDEIFGVTNNKQGAMTFQRLAHFSYDREQLDDKETPRDVRARMKADGDPRFQLLDLHEQVKKTIELVRKKAKLHRQSRSRRHDDVNLDDATVMATEEIVRRIDEGRAGVSDHLASGTAPDEIQETQIDSLVSLGYDVPEATRIVVDTIEAGNRVRWIQTSQDTESFFTVESLPQVIQVVLNSQHPVARDLYDVLHPDTEIENLDDALEHLHKSSASFRLLLYAWARYEDEQNDERRRLIRQIRREWGQYADGFFTIESAPPDLSDRI